MKKVLKVGAVVCSLVGLFLLIDVVSAVFQCYSDFSHNLLGYCLGMFFAASIIFLSFIPIFTLRQRQRLDKPQSRFSLILIGLIEAFVFIVFLAMLFPRL
jgi:uncharacterized membrane protein